MGGRPVWVTLAASTPAPSVVAPVDGTVDPDVVVAPGDADVLEPPAAGVEDPLSARAPTTSPTMTAAVSMMAVMMRPRMGPPLVVIVHQSTSRIPALLP